MDTSITKITAKHQRIIKVFLRLKLGIIDWMVMDAFQENEELNWASLTDVNKLNAITAVNEKIKVSNLIYQVFI